MATASEIFDKIAAAYATNADKAFFLEMAESRVNASNAGYGLNRPLAVALRAAHDMELAKGGAFSGSGGSGAVSSKTEGKLSVSFGQSAQVANDMTGLSATKYGQQLLELSRSSFVAFGVCGDFSEGTCGW